MAKIQTEIHHCKLVTIINSRVNFATSPPLRLTPVFWDTKLCLHVCNCILSYVNFLSYIEILCSKILNISSWLRKYSLASFS